MVSDPSLALQGAIVAALKSAATAAGANVFDTVPSSSPFPRITIGPSQEIGDYADCYNGTESFLQIDVWSRALGFPQAKTIAGEVRDALHAAELTIPGHVLELLEFQNSQSLVDPDGLTRHVAMTFRALTQPDT